MCLLELTECSLDLGLLVRGDLVAEILELVLGLEDYAVGLIELIDLLFLLLIVVGISLCFSLHTIDLLLRETAGGLDADLLLLAGPLVASGYVDDTIGIDVEGHLDLRHTTLGREDAVEIKLPEGLIVLRHRTLTLEHMDLHRGLVVRCGGEDLRLLRRDGGIGVDQPGHHTAHGLDTE